MAKIPELNDYQGALFAQTSEGAIAHIPIFPSDPRDKLLGQPEIPVSYGPEGSYVDLIERAKFLSETLALFGKSNQRVGFDLASNSRQYSGPIWGRYQEATPRVQEGAETNRLALQTEAKAQFWQATGYAGLRAAGLLPTREINAGARKMWGNFTDKYAPTGEPAATKRKKYVKRLNKTIKTSQKIIESQAA